MQRRKFVSKSLLSAGGILSTPYFLTASKKNVQLKGQTFPLNFAPHAGMFKYSAGDDIIDQLNFMSGQGFTAFEDNGMRQRPVKQQEEIATTLLKNNMTMGVFVAHKIYWEEANLAGGNAVKRKEFLSEIKASVEVAKRVNAKWMTVVPGHLDLHLSKDYQTKNVIETLKYAAEILEQHHLVMVLEPLNFRDHPSMFLSESPQAYQICKAVDSPSCKILFDVYHQQVQEGNLIPNIEKCWDEIAYFQVGDNPGRNEPATGEINYKNVFKFIYDKGFKGVVGMEHGNSKPGKKGEQAVINTYKQVSKF